MSNEEIIAGIAINIYGEDRVNEMIENGDDIPLHTLNGWAKVGRRVKPGEHGIETRLWKKKKRDKSKDVFNEEDSKSKNRDFYLCKSYLFKEDQVELIKE